MVSKLKRDEYVRSARISTKLFNKGKKQALNNLYENCKKLTQDYINIIWDSGVSIRSTFSDKEEYDLVVAKWATVRLKQTCCQKAKGIIKGVKAKQKKRLFIYDKLVEENDIVNANKLKLVIDKVKMSRPELKNYSLDLNEQFVRLDNINTKRMKLRKTKHKDWIHLSSIGNRKSYNLPFIRTKIYNKWLNKKDSIRSKFIQIVENGQIKLVFKILRAKKIKGNVEGCDIGLNNVWSLSNKSQAPNANTLNQSLNTIIRSMCLRTRGGVGIKKRREHRHNFINWSINQMDLSNVRKIKLEDINISTGNNLFLNYWSYRQILNKIEHLCEENDVDVEYINPHKTSQRCFSCGYTHENNRKGKLFDCIKCENKDDADTNASYNILHLKRGKKINGTSVNGGFYYTI